MLFPSKDLHPFADIPKADTTLNADVAAQLLYEEIRGAPVPVTPVSTPVTPADHVESEDMKPGDGVAESGGTYHFTMCSAYGVPTHGKI